MNTIKRLEIFGFKSFYNRQEIIFPPHMNVIMGPNGSGKSNVIEALTFVLGKSSRKELRAEKMSDLVYNGSKKLPPAKFAKVTVIIDNKNRKMPIDEDEVKISRQVNKEGTSGIFKVNGRRQQKEYISNLLYHALIDPDGYNIVMQGEIEQFIVMPGEQRRKIIEDLSGISIYEDKKHKCLLELDKVQLKINEANILLKEKIKHMEELQEQKEEAEKVFDLRDKFNYKKAAKLTVETREIEKVRDEVKKQYDTKMDVINKHTEARNKILSKTASENETLEKLNKELEQQGEVEQVELNKQIANLKNRSNELKTLIKSEENEIKRMSERKDGLTKDFDANKERLKEIESKISTLNTEVNAEKELLKSQEEKFEKLNNIDRERVRLLSAINDIETGMLELKTKLAVFQNLDEIKREKEETRKQIEEMSAELSAKLEENSGIAAKLAEFEEKLNIRSRGLHQLEGKQEALLRFLDHSVQVIIHAKKSKKLTGIHGVVSELGKTSDEYTLPLKVAAGSRANAVVVDDVETTKQCITFLRENKSGKATFLPLDKIKYVKFEKKDMEQPGFIGYAIDLIKFKPQYENIFNYVFRDTIIVEDFEAARKIGINKYRMVTLSGELFEKSGAISGGYRRKIDVGFKEEPIEDEIERLRSEVGEIQQEINVLEPQKEKTADEISILRGRIYTADEKLKDFKEIDLSEAERINAELKKREAEQNVLWGEVKELPKKVAQEFLSKLNEKLKAQRDKIAVLEGDKKGYEVQIEIIGRDIERFVGLIKGIDRENKDFEKRISDNNKELTSAEGSLSKKLVEEEKFYGKLKELYAKRNKLMETTKELEIERNKIEIQIDVIRKDAQEFQLKIAEVNARIEGKLAALEEFRGIEVKAVKDTPEELARQIEDLQKMIEEYGNVNMRALEIYHDVEKQYNALKERTEKLFAEKGDVLQVMSEVEGQKKETFMQTFESIAKSFSHVFSVISIKGEGSLILENPENPFAGGVEIIAKPGGKKMVSLRSMSGGEKTLTTLAFIFAVQECSPSSFYIMDEVDAALDPENAERLGVLISEYAKDSQFIMISHNPAVIEQGDCIFGVDMNELGESRVQSLALPAK